MRKNSTASLEIILIALLLGFPSCSLGATADTGSSLVGNWQGTKGQTGYTLTLSSDGKGSLNGAAIEWRYSDGNLHMKAAKGSFDYKAAFTSTTLTLTGNDLEQPLIFERLNASTTAARQSGPNMFPIPGNPPLTSEDGREGCSTLRMASGCTTDRGTTPAVPEVL